MMITRATKILTPLLMLGTALATWTVPVLAQTTAYVGATIETGDQAGRLENATLVVSGDQIVAVGTDVPIPADARVVSAAGKTLMPGIIDPYFVFASGSSGTETRTVTFRGRTFTVPSGGDFKPGTFQEVGKYFFPYKFDFRPAVRSGITTANLVTDGQGLSGFAALQWEPSPEMLFESQGRLFAKVTNQTDSLDTVRKPLDEAKPSKPAESKPGESSPTAGKEKAEADDSPQKYWREVVEGQRRLFINLNNSAAVAYLLEVAEKHEKAKIVLVATGDNLYPSLAAIAKLKNVELVLQPGIDTVPFTRDLMNVPRLLEEQKIPFALSLSLSSSQLKSSQDDPLFPIASLVETGLDRQQALQAVTLKPAQMLGIDSTHGSLAPQKRANFLVFAGDPLGTGSRLEQIYVNGKLIHEN